MELIEKKKLRREFEDLIERFGPSHFITLATNAYKPVAGLRMRDLLKAWSARVNRSLLGGRWQKKPDEHIQFYAFLEKPKENPHWHLLVQADLEMIEDRDEWEKRFAFFAEKAWVDLLPSGTIDIQEYKTREVIEYTLKAALGEVEYISYFVPREFS